SARFFNDRAWESTGYLSPLTAANRYGIMVASDSACYATTAMMDCWRVNKLYKSARDSILLSIKDFLGIEWLLSGDKSVPSGLEFASVDEHLDRISQVIIDSTVPGRIFVHAERGQDSYFASVDEATGRIQWIKENLFGQCYFWWDWLPKFVSDSLNIIALHGESDQLTVVDYASGEVSHTWHLNIDPLKYDTSHGFATYRDYRLLDAGSSGITFALELEHRDTMLFDILLERYTWDGSRIEQRPVRTDIGMDLAKGSGFLEAGPFLIIKYSPYTDWRATEGGADHFDSLLVYDRETLRPLGAFGIDQFVIRWTMVGSHMITMDTSRIRGYQLPDGNISFEIERGLSHRIGEGRIIAVTDTQFVFLNDTTITGYLISERYSPSLQRLYTSNFYSADKSDPGASADYIGQSGDKLYFLRDYIITSVSFTTGEVLFKRPVLQPRFWWFDHQGISDDFIILNAGPFLFRVPAEEGCD
ncbi:hypothetical protein ACFLQW_04545, partial [Candidatus Zixiibacteriota bacterium]